MPNKTSSPQPELSETHTNFPLPLMHPDTGSNGTDLQDQRQSKKREREEREVSLEPVNIPKTSHAGEAGATQSRETRTPAKRNKRMLESTKEEIEDETSKAASQSRSRSRSHSMSPPLVSPDQNKVMQGVEDPNRKNPKTLDKKVQGIVASSTLAPPKEVDGKTSLVDDGVITEVKDNDSQLPIQQEVEDEDTARHADGSDDKVAQVNTVSTELEHVKSQSKNLDKALRCRYEDREIGQGTDEGQGVLKVSPKTTKHPRDDEDEDPNPRESKRPTPPPAPETKKSSPKPSPPSPEAAPKLTGFEAYASLSPFSAAAKGLNIFSSGKNMPVPVTASLVPSNSSSSFTSAPGEASSPSKSLKRSGFEAFASTPSSFSIVTRSESPVLGQPPKFASQAKSSLGRTNSVSSNPFEQYTDSSQGFRGFGVPVPKRPKAESPPESPPSSLEKTSTINALNRNMYQNCEDDNDDDDEKETSFGEKLRAAEDEGEEDSRSDEELKAKYTEQEVITGEEDDYTIHQVRSKLFSLEDGQWKERGTGLLKLNVKDSDGTGARLVMRRDAVCTILLNIVLFCGMACTLAPQDPRYLRFSAIENGSTTHYNLRLVNNEAARDLFQKIISNIPPA